MWHEWSTLEKLIWLKRRIGGGASWVWRTITGSAPLTLANAVHHAIQSLTQYGLCTQESTPTPDAPVDILCNNGALCMVDDELPTGYKRVLGFSCDNNALWEITGFKLKGSDTVRISFSVNAGCNVFGCYQGTDATDNYDLYVSTSYNAKYLRYGGGTYLSAWAAADLGKRFDVVYTPYGSQGMPQDSTWSPLTFTSANDLLIGSTTLIGTSAKLKGNLYGDFIVDGRLKLVPCERVSDGVLGYYDTYSETFYEPYTGFDGAVSLGYDGSHYSLQTVGTPETLTVSGVNLANMVADNIDVGKIIYETGAVANSPVNFVYSEYIPVEAGQNYVMYGRRRSDNVISAYNRICWYDESKGWISRATYTKGTIGSAVAPNNAAYARFTVAPYDSPPSALTLDDVLAFDWTFAKANEEIPYEPYVQPQTVSVPMLLGVGDYKDEAEIIQGIKTGRVGIKVFDGTEDWTAFTSSTLVIQNATSAWGAVAGVGGYCTHLTVLKAGETTFAGSCRFATAFNLYEYKTAFGVADVAGFKAKLASEYANGTPVILVYPLATETTEQTQAHALHTTEGTVIVDVTANVSPVELEVEYASNN